MKKLYGYLLSHFIGPFFLTFIICVFILMMQFLWRFIDELVGKGLGNMLILELFSYAAISFVPLAIPLAVLLASLMTFGNLGERFELLAMKSSGLSLLKMMKPLILFVTGIAMVTFFLANEVVPVANAKFMALLWSINKQRPEMIIKEGVFYDEIDHFSIKVNQHNPVTNALLDIIIYDHRNQGGNEQVIIADSGYLKMSDDKMHMVLTLFSGERYQETPGIREKTANYPFQREHFRKETMVVPVKDYKLERADEKNWSMHAKMLKNREIDSIAPHYQKRYEEKEALLTKSIQYNQVLNSEIINQYHPDSIVVNFLPPSVVPFDVDVTYKRLNKFDKTRILNTAQHIARANQLQLIRHEADLKNNRLLTNKYWIEWHRKYTLSLACMVFFFIGAPLGAIIRKGGFGLPVVLSIFFYIAYYLISAIGEKMALEGVLDRRFLLWFPTALFFVAGILLTHQAVSDSTLLNTDFYRARLKRLWKTIGPGKNGI